MQSIRILKQEWREPAGQSLSLQDHKQPQEGTSAFPYLMSHQQGDIVFIGGDASVVHSKQLTFHWTVINFAWLTLNVIYFVSV